MIEQEGGEVEPNELHAWTIQVNYRITAKEAEAMEKGKRGIRLDSHNRLGASLPMCSRCSRLWREVYGTSCTGTIPPVFGEGALL